MILALFMWQLLHKGLLLDEKVILLKRILAESWDNYKESYDSKKLVRWTLTPNVNFLMLYKSNDFGMGQI